MTIARAVERGIKSACGYGWLRATGLNGDFPNRQIVDLQIGVEGALAK
jgi:hypothetical protein